MSALLSPDLVPWVAAATIVELLAFKGLFRLERWVDNRRRVTS